MEKEFWLERWKRKEIGFHQHEINPYLVRYWPDLSVPRGAKVFVPLCGKSRDMLWLRQQGYSILGVEVSPLAVHGFFLENGYSCTHAPHGRFERCEADNIEILCGDFFDLEKDDLKGVHSVYDRASLVALPPEMRERYVRHLTSVLPVASRILLVAFDYNQSEMPGPPFSVSRLELESLFGARAKVDLVAEHDALAQNPHFRERGLHGLQENVFLITLR